MVAGKRQTERRPKTVLTALREYLEGEGEPPSAYLEAKVLELTHWTWDVLDMQDEGRTASAMTLVNLASGYERARRAAMGHNTEAASGSDWAAWQALHNAAKDS